jgi:hypothetical protein
MTDETGGMNTACRLQQKKEAVARNRATAFLVEFSFSGGTVRC